MAKHWFGEFIMDSFDSRDEAAVLVEDHVEATPDVVPHEVGGWEAGVERRSNLSIPPDNGPGFRWSIKIPDDGEAAAAAVAQTIQSLPTAVNGSSGFTQL